MTSWLHGAISRTGLPHEPYYPYMSSILSADNMDAAEKCEALLDILEQSGALSAESAESLVRTVLEALEQHGVRPLLDPLDPDYGSYFTAYNTAGATGMSSRNGAVNGALSNNTTNGGSNGNNGNNHGLPAYAITHDISHGEYDAFYEPELYDSDQYRYTADTIDLGDPIDAADTGIDSRIDGNDDEEDAYWEFEESQGYNSLSPQDVLQSIFVNHPPDVILATMQAQSYNIEATIEALLAIPNPSEHPDPFAPASHPVPIHTPPARSSGSPSKQQTNSRPVCRHFMLGQCYRSDCWFSHDPEALICKFWLQGRCLKGSSCEFVHGDDLLERVQSMGIPTSSQSSASQPTSSGRSSNRNSGTIDTKPVSLDLKKEDDFPSLNAATAASKSKTSSSSPATASATPSTASSGIKSAPKIDFWAPTVKYNDVAKKPATSAKSAVTPLAGKKYTVIGGSGASFTNNANSGALDTPHATASYSGTNSTSLSATATATVSSTRGKARLSTQWVSTGGSLSATYAEYRRDAIEAAINRNRLFQRATEAYLSGNRAAARALSLQAKQINDQVQQLHSAAAQRIFTERNKYAKMPQTIQHPQSTHIPSSAPPALSMQGIPSTVSQHMIDLHGLHPDEAITILQSCIDELCRHRFAGQLVIVTGTGHHSRSNRAKVLPAVRYYLVSAGWRPIEATLEDQRGGMLVIEMKP
eukprot:jgi/Hompol1/6330/HPOL_002252-RA